VVSEGGAEAAAAEEQEPTTPPPSSSSPPPPMGVAIGVAIGMIEGVSTRLGFFGERRQQAVVSVAWQEHSILARLLSERLLVIGSVKDALAARETVRKALSAATENASLRGEQLEAAGAKEGLARAKAAQGKGGKEGDKLEALFFSRIKEKDAAEELQAKAVHMVAVTKVKLAGATGRLETEWRRVDESWTLSCKAAFLEAAHANDRLHQIPVAALQALHQAIAKEQSEEKVAAALEAQEGQEAAASAAAAAAEEHRLVLHAKAAELKAEEAARLASEAEAAAEAEAKAAVEAEETAAAAAKAEEEKDAAEETAAEPAPKDAASDNTLDTIDLSAPNAAAAIDAPTSGDTPVVEVVSENALDLVNANVTPTVTSTVEVPALSDTSVISSDAPAQAPTEQPPAAIPEHNQVLPPDSPAVLEQKEQWGEEAA